MPDMIKNRPAVKALARERDEDRLRAGEISSKELQKENLAFRRFKKGVIGFGPKHRPASARYVAAYAEN